MVQSNDGASCFATHSTSNPARHARHLDAVGLNSSHGGARIAVAIACDETPGVKDPSHSHYCYPSQSLISSREIFSLANFLLIMVLFTLSSKSSIPSREVLSSPDYPSLMVSYTALSKFPVKVREMLLFLIRVLPKGIHWWGYSVTGQTTPRQLWSQAIWNQSPTYQSSRRELRPDRV